MSKDKTADTMSREFWTDGHTWRSSASNTFWCLLGCSIGDFGTILFFQFSNYSLATLWIMILAIINGLITSIALETFILVRKGTALRSAFKTAIGMSFISMLAMEIVMNIVDFALTGSASIVWWVIPPMLVAGFITPWPYNYWRLKALAKTCH